MRGARATLTRVGDNLSLAYGDLLRLQPQINRILPLALLRFPDPCIQARLERLEMGVHRDPAICELLVDDPAISPG